MHQPDLGRSLQTLCAGRRLSITIRPDGRVILTLPGRGAAEQARRFLDSRVGWIQKHRAQIRRHQSRPAPPAMTREQFIEAQRSMFRRLEELAAQHGYRFSRVVVRCQKTRWASCSSLGTISLNVNLIFLPPHLLDYVLLHELVHTRHPNHGPRFWAELDTCCNGRAKALQKELRGHSMQIY